MISILVWILLYKQCNTLHYHFDYVCLSFALLDHYLWCIHNIIRNWNSVPKMNCKKGVLFLQIDISGENIKQQTLFVKFGFVWFFVFFLT